MLTICVVGSTTGDIGDDPPLGAVVRVRCHGGGAQDPDVWFGPRHGGPRRH